MIDIDRTEALRYVGVKEEVSDERLLSMVNDCCDEINSLTAGKYIYEIFNIKKHEESVEIEDAGLNLKSVSIARHLKDSERCIVFAATLGVVIDNRIRFYSKMDLEKSIIFDACASSAIEAVCNSACDEIGTRINKEFSLGITGRFSPGYGDLALTCQKNVLRVLKADKRIGLTCSDSSLLIPTKSVTALIGMQSPDIKVLKAGCSSCERYADCRFRKEGIECGR